MGKLIFIIIAVILSACSPSQSAVETAIYQTQMAMPTYTPTPTLTPTSTTTPTPTLTPTPDRSGEIKYSQTFNNLILTLLKQIKTLDEMTQEINRYPYLFRDKNWTDRLRNISTSIVGIGQVMTEFSDVPEIYTRVDELSDDLHSELIEFEKDYMRGIREQNSFYIKLGYEHLDNSLDIITVIQKLLKENQ